VAAGASPEWPFAAG